MARFRGIIPPLITPLADRDALDREGLARLIEHVLAGGVDGVFILGTSGEAPSLSYRLRRELIGLTCRQVAGRAPVLVGVTDTAFAESVNMAAAAADAGADAVVLSAPYYFPAGQAELAAYCEDILPRLPLPVMLYNMPAMTKVWFAIETLRRLAAIERIVGVKDSGGDSGYFGRLAALKNERPDWSVLVGPEHLLIEAVRRGGDGGVNGGANILPRLFVDCYKAAAAGDGDRAGALGGLIAELGEIYRVGRHASRVIKGIKCALSLTGICGDVMAEPFHRFNPPERRRVRAVLQRLRDRDIDIPLQPEHA